MMRAAPLCPPPAKGLPETPILAEFSVRIPKEAACLFVTNNELEIGL